MIWNGACGLLAMLFLIWNRACDLPENFVFVYIKIATVEMLFNGEFLFFLINSKKGILSKINCLRLTILMYRTKQELRPGRSFRFPSRLLWLFFSSLTHTNPKWEGNLKLFVAQVSHHFHQSVGLSTDHSTCVLEQYKLRATVIHCTYKAPLVSLSYRPIRRAPGAQVFSTARHCWGVHVPSFVHKDMRKSCFFLLFMEIKCFPQRITQFP